VYAESLNFAVLKRLPVLFVCENNRYAIHTHQSRRQGRPAICERARAHGMPAECFEADDVVRLYERVRPAVQRVRAGGGPRLVEVLTYRWREHVGPNEDYHLGYRTPAEAARWVEGDAVRRLAGELSPADRAQIEAEVEDEVREAFAFAEASPFPAPAELWDDVFKEERHEPVGYATC
jgi:TPP-dependent pyruvate/acetoin dehydrogenase alpha subunit